MKKNDPSALKLIMQPNEKLVYNKSQSATNADVNPVTKKAESKKQPVFSAITIPDHKPDSLLQETSWRFNKLIFEGDSFEELTVKMERWYNVSITINGEDLKQLRFKGIFTTESVRQALEALKLTAFFKYKISADEIEIFK
jgi:ferric-dicitrate binding protein FerR (iron transport regulator)